MHYKFDAFCMCNPLFDIQAEVPEGFIEQLGYAKGGMYLVQEEQQKALLPGISDFIVNTEPGGSGANTAIGVALLGGRAVYTGGIGDDLHGEHFGQGMTAKGVKPNLGSSSGDTGTCLVLITPDAQRTMFTYLGNSLKLTKDYVNLEDLKSSQYLYVTAYLWDTESQKEAVLYAMKEANRAGVKVTLSLSDPFCVGRHKDDLLKLCKDHVDVIFGNATEAQQLTDTETHEEAARVLSEWSDIAIVTLDSAGSLIRSKDQEVRVPVYPVKALDTTGAGDMYAAGWLFGLSHDLGYLHTGRLASYTAAQVVAQIGPRLSEVNHEALFKVTTGVGR